MMPDTLLLPFTFPFMRDAFLMAAIIAVPAALLSCFLVLKGWALMGDAVSHAVLPGIVLAYLAGLPLILGAFAAGMTAALATGFLAENSRVKRDTVMGVVFSGMFAAGIVMFVAIRTNVHLDHVLFGNLLGVGPEDLRTAGLIAAAVTAVLLLKWKDFLLHAFDPAQARVSGLPVAALHYLMLAMLSLMVVATLTATGLVLAVGLLIAPGATAFLLVRSFGRMLAVACAVSLCATLGGTYASFFLDSAPGATIMLTFTLIFLAVFARHLVRARRSRFANRQPS